MKSRKAIIRGIVKNMLKESQKAMFKKLNSLLIDGAIDIDNYNPDYDGLLLPKAIVSALLESEVQQYNGKGTSFERSQKKEIKKIYYSI